MCPVRRATDEVKRFLAEYVSRLEERGVEVFYPARDNPHEGTDRIGDKICDCNAIAIDTCDEVHIYWDESSAGSKFDLGMAFVFEKPIVLINEVDSTETKSFNSLLKHWPWGVEEILPDDYIRKTGRRW